MTAELPNFKKFVSEDDIAAAKQKRQEEWEKVRQPNQPEEAPEEVYDPRSLFERLESNRIKKQEEFDESHRLKNMVKGLENDEIEFLERVSQQKEQEEQKKDLEERLLLAEYKSSLVHDRTVEQEQEIELLAKKPLNKSLPQKHVNSQKKLLAGIIRKRSATDSEELEVKKAKTGKADLEVQDRSEALKLADKPAVDVKSTTPGLLPGIGDYSDSSSETD